MIDKILCWLGWHRWCFSHLHTDTSMGGRYPWVRRMHRCSRCGNYRVDHQP